MLYANDAPAALITTSSRLGYSWAPRKCSRLFHTVDKLSIAVSCDTTWPRKSQLWIAKWLRIRLSFIQSSEIWKVWESCKIKSFYFHWSLPLAKTKVISDRSLWCTLSLGPTTSTAVLQPGSQICSWLCFQKKLNLQTLSYLKPPLGVWWRWEVFLEEITTFIWQHSQ